VPPTGRKGIRIDRGSPAEKAELLAGYLLRDGLLGAGPETARVTDGRSPVQKGSGRICVFIEQSTEGTCRNISMELLTPAMQIGDAAALRLSAILVGPDNARAIEELKRYPVDEIISCEASETGELLLHDYAEAVSEAVEKYEPEGLLIGATELGKALSARVAARFRTGLTAECSGVRYDAELEKLVWSRPAYGGKLMADIVCKDRLPQMGTVREGVFEKPAPYPSRPEIIAVHPGRSSLSGKITVIDKAMVPGFSSKTDHARSIVVGMGRGIRDIDGFDLCCDFADAIGADIGASRGATELRIVSGRYLIGSNGRTIRPAIYFACGISGSLQHMTGVLDSRCIVAINKDPKAEIFQYADYCLVGDLFQILPELQKVMERM